MKRGLLFGKFMPMHSGHIDLINFAAENCHHLTVLVTYKKNEPIPGHIRLTWLWETFRDNKKIHIDYTDKELPDSEKSCKHVSKIWGNYLIKKYPQVDTIFSSEDYGKFIADAMKISYEDFDKERKIQPISATMIRQNPMKYWDFIPNVVKPYFTKKICIYGPESTGKTILTEELSNYYKTEFVPEMTREIHRDRHVVYKDIEKIAKLHASEILEKEKNARRFLFCDTDIITTKIYSEHYFKKIPEFAPWIEAANKFHLYLFCDIDVLQEEDPQKDAGHMREELRMWFISELEKYELPYELVYGPWDERFDRAREAIEKHFGF